jgi:hypothetical protein
MNLLERFFLSHPDLMRFHFDSRPLVCAVGAVICLLLVFVLRPKAMNSGTVALPSRAIRCFQLCWLAGFPSLVIESYTSARGITPQGYVLAFEGFCYLLWLVLFVAGIAGILRFCFQEAREKRRDAPFSS